MVEYQNFAMNIVEAQCIDTFFNADHSLTKAGQWLQALHFLFLTFFFLEITVNIVVNWGKQFFHSPWNVLDLVLVLASFLSTFTFPHQVVLRLVRILRVLRIFGKVDVLRQVFSALGAALFPVASAFFILIIMICMCKFCLSRPLPQQYHC
jgi:hypothetical protein